MNSSNNTTEAAVDIDTNTQVATTEEVPFTDSVEFPVVGETFSEDDLAREELGNTEIPAVATVGEEIPDEKSTTPHNFDSSTGEQPFTRPLLESTQEASTDLAEPSLDEFFGLTSEGTTDVSSLADLSGILSEDLSAASSPEAVPPTELSADTPTTPLSVELPEDISSEVFSNVIEPVTNGEALGVENSKSDVFLGNSAFSPESDGSDETESTIFAGTG